MVLFAAMMLAACSAPSFAADAAQNNFDAVRPGPAVAAGAAKYLHLEGSLQGDDDALLADLEKTFLAPLETTPAAMLYSDVLQVNGAGYVRLNLIIEAVSPADAAALAAYVSGFERQGYRGLTVKFQDVSRIDTALDLQIGVYTPSAEDAFTMHYQTPGRLSAPSFAAWLASYNAAGYGVIAPKQADFEAFLRKFVGDAKKFEDIRRRLLPANDMIVLASQTTVELRGGGVAGPQADSGPFIPFNFTRNCTLSRYENGKCSGAPNPPKPLRAPDLARAAAAGLDWN